MATASWLARLMAKALPLDTTKIYGFKPGTGWVEAGGGSGGGIPEAPEDGTTYGRKDGDWVAVESGGSVGSWAALPTVQPTYYYDGGDFTIPPSARARLEENVVRLEGGFEVAALVSGSGSQQNMCQLPVGMRPSRSYDYSIPLDDGTVRRITIIGISGVVQVSTSTSIAAGRKIFFGSLTFPLA